MQSDTASRSGAPASISSIAWKLAMPSTLALRLAAAISSKSLFAATAGKCWSRTIFRRRQYRDG
jgi:hypothetical protein